MADIDEPIPSNPSDPGDEGYQAAHTGFDLSVSQHPALIVGATTTADAMAAVDFARSHRLGVGVQATGHGPTVAANGGLLINTSRMNTIDVDSAGARLVSRQGRSGPRSSRPPHPTVSPLWPAQRHRSAPFPTASAGGSGSSVVDSGSVPTMSGPWRSSPPTVNSVE